ncbi:MAG: winged helix DNA-binding domain-containing protein [Anaerolineales bacterium]|nr:winged helix DNA-binding domain-containing protein [Anaerolineales bacterium]
MPRPLAISERTLGAYRRRTFRTGRGQRLRTPQEAVQFVRERGFVHFWPIQGVDLPSLWTAVAGDRPVAEFHDDPGHVTWGWKDSLLGARKWHYAKLLRGKATLVSLPTLPHFYALSDRLGDLDDYVLAYESGRISREARLVADGLLRHGAQHTLQLRAASHLDAASSKSRFEKALVELQRGLWILPIGVAQAGSWNYAFIYEMVDRWYPGLLDQARPLSLEQARAHLARRLLDSVGIATPLAFQRLFRWTPAAVQQALDDLRQARAGLPLDDGRWASRRLLRAT